ncbi:MAG: carbohydrate binding family 9 domain-containing protein [Gemmatimonadetes bacterium]|nr:carbohydrate binding family 9 domain-containing protein [Gemmatimonadota bacterium]
MPLTALTPVLLTAFQVASSAQANHRPAADPPAPVAARALRPPVIDGKDLDQVWRDAQRITEFREFQPHEGGEPRFGTEARVAYDPHNFYVFVRMFEPHPDSILRLMARRDVRTASDQIKIMIDSYRDHRTGYEFAVNPAGVKRDYAIYNDGEEDDAWDAVWEAATTIDSLGWTAEFRIPLSQLRYTPGPSKTFGFGVWRDIQRYTERLSWPLYRVSQAGLVSQLGEITGLDGLAAPRRLELRPYGVAKNVSVPDVSGFGRSQRLTGGADVKYGLTSNLTLDATINPDFGQVEADPAVVNLTAFETFFDERRPFFVEGSGLFRFPVNCFIVNDCSTGEGLFYSRRIGRAPQLAGRYPTPEAPTATAILGAVKLSGRLPQGLSLGLLDAVTRRVGGAGGATLEPATNYAVLRAQQDLRQGESNVGLLVTAVNRDLDPRSTPYLRRQAYVGAVDFRHRFPGKRYQLSGEFDVSRVAGSAEVMAATQRDPVHYYQRSDGGLPYDPARTALDGYAGEIRFAKFGGERTRFETAYGRRSAGFEINDLGYLRRADEQNSSSWFNLRWTRPAAFYQQAYCNFNWWQHWTTGGLPIERAFNSNTHIQFNSRWWIHFGGTIGRLGGVFCDRCARGGPAVRTDPVISLWGGTNADDRRPLIPNLWFNYAREDGGRTRFFNLSPGVSARASTRFSSWLGVSFPWNPRDTQWYGNFTDSVGTPHYTFAHLEQRTASLTWRGDYTFTPDLTLQVYAQPFVSQGTYGDVRELADPRAPTYDDRYQPYGDPAVAGNPGGFNFKQFRSNVVLRWEYQPGSTLFLVWAQGRGASAPTEGSGSLAGDFGELFRLRADNTFLVKASYWINR